MVCYILAFPTFPALIFEQYCVYFVKRWEKQNTKYKCSITSNKQRILYSTWMLLTSSFCRSDDHTRSVRGSAWQEGIWSRFGLETTHLQTQNYAHQFWIHLRTLPPWSMLSETKTEVESESAYFKVCRRACVKNVRLQAFMSITLTWN